MGLYFCQLLILTSVIQDYIPVLLGCKLDLAQGLMVKQCATAIHDQLDHVSAALHG
jgi:hypothetical protein